MLRFRTIILSLTFLAQWSEANEDVKVDELEYLLITASRINEKAFEAPYNLHSVEETELVLRSVRSVPEVFSYIPGVVVQKTAHGQGSPYIRGFTAYNNLFLIDGIRLNNAAFRSGPNQYWNTIDSQSLRALELVKSQGSVLFGSDSVGGTVQALTRRPIYGDTGRLQGGRSFSRFATSENSFIQRGELFQSEAGKYGLIAGGTYKDFGNIEAAGLGELPFTGYDERDFDAKYEYYIDPDTQLTLFHNRVHVEDAWRVHKTIHAKSWAGSSVGNEQARILDQDRMLSYIQLRGASTSTYFDAYTLSASLHQHGEERYRKRSDGRTDIQGFELDSYGLWAQFEKDNGNSKTVYGASYYLDRADSYRNDWNADGSFKENKIQGALGDDGTYHLLGAFFNSQTSLGERLDLDWGARYTYAQTEIQKVQDPSTGDAFSIKDNWDNIVASGRLSYLVDDQGLYRIFGGVSQAFRAPNFSDLSRLDSNRSNEVETPSPDLTPEEFTTFELGLKADTGLLSGSISYYYTDVEDMIMRTPTGNIIDGENEVIKSNVGDGYVQGFELEASMKIDDHTSLFGGFAYQNSSVSTYPTSDPILQDEYLSRVMPTNGFLGLRKELRNGKLWLEGVVRLAGKGDRLNTRDTRDTQRIPPGGTPSYRVASFRTGWLLKDNLLLTAAIENIFDEEYRSHGSGQNEPGTNLILGAEYKF